MANDNWELLGDKMRSYRPAVDADAAWQGVLGQLNAVPQPMRLSRLVGWKAAEMGVLVLWFLVLSWMIPAVDVPALPAASPVPFQARQGLAETPASVPPGEPAAAKADNSVPMRPIGSAKRALPPPVDRTTDTQFTERSTINTRLPGADGAATQKQTGHSSPPRAAGGMVLDPPSSVPRLAATGPVDPLTFSLPQWSVSSTYPAYPAERPDDRSPSDRTVSEFSAPVALEIAGGVGPTAGSGIAPFVGVQLRYAVGPRGSLVLGAAYQRVSGMNLHWHQAEYDKDFGYPTGNAVDRWLDSYGAWEYSIDYRQQIIGRLALQTGVQLTVLQERGLRERIQGSDFFLGSSRRSLVDRDFGLRFGLDYRLSRNFAVFAQYLHGLGDISPNHLYESQAVQRHGGLRIGLRLTPFLPK